MTITNLMQKWRTKRIKKTTNMGLSFPFHGPSKNQSFDLSTNSKGTVNKKRNKSVKHCRIEKVKIKLNLEDLVVEEKIMSTIYNVIL